MAKRVLVVDDEPLMRDMLYSALRRKKMPVDRAENGKIAFEMITKNKYDMVLTDMRMPYMSGLELLAQTKKKYPDIDFIMLTAYGTIDDAVKAMQLGAYDFIEKKENTFLDEIELRIDKLIDYRRLKNRNVELTEELDNLKKESIFEKSFIGKDKKMLDLFQTISKVADSSATVFIQGESGTGKELVAQAIHDQSPRKKMPFIKVNCAALPDGLIESELFGHEKGAFTGAIRSTQGKFELANGGTILLDEITEMNPLLQAKLLRVLQEREFEKIGDSKVIKLDIRIVATTNKDIHKAIKDGSFREDLFYRLNVINLRTDTLRERKSDIPILADFFLKKYNRIHNRKIDLISPETMKLLLSLQWKGNVRELENTIERAVVLSKGNIIIPEAISVDGETDSFKVDYNNNNTDDSGSSGIMNNFTSTDDVVSISKLEQLAILRSLKLFEGNRTKTADALQISIRTLRNKLNEYRAQGIEVD